MLWGALATGAGIPQNLDLDTMELFLRFFTVEELITDLHIHELGVRELTILKASLLQEVARQIAQQTTLKDAVKGRCRAVFSALGAAHTGK